MALISNKKAYFDYEITDKYNAGLELLGTEVKSIKVGQGTLEGAQVIVRGGEAYLVGANIPAYQPQNAPKNYDPERTRRLLLQKREIVKLASESSSRHLTIVPISVYNRKTNLKLEIGLGKKKKKYDKRETIKKRDTEREVRRSLK